MVVLASLGLSFILIHSTLLKMAGISSLEQVIFRILLSLPLLLLIFRKEVLVSWLDLNSFLPIGLVFSAFLLSALSAIIAGVPIAVVVALIYTQPIFTAVISQILGKETLTRGKLLMIGIGSVGAFLVTGLRVSDVLGLRIGGGIILALGCGFLYALYLLLKRKMRERGYTPSQITFNTFLCAIPATLLLGLGIRQFTTDVGFVGFVMPNPYQWLWLFSFAIFSTTLPYTALNFVNPHEIAPVTEGLILLLDPVLHTMWAALIFWQFISPSQYVGIFLVILAAGMNLKLK
jgi:drug/metabolite transporter (DMT)-like permease